MQVPSSARTRARRDQRGVMLIEALIAILIFSIGILGIVGLQASAVKQSTEARYRAEAAHLAQQLLGTMWTGQRQLTTLQTQFNTCSGSTCAGYQAWLGNVRAVLPGIDADAGTLPSVNVDANGVVTISIFWRPPGEGEDAGNRRYDIQAQILQ